MGSIWKYNDTYSHELIVEVTQDDDLSKEHYITMEICNDHKILLSRLYVEELIEFLNEKFLDVKWPV